MSAAGFAEVLDFWFGAPGSPQRGRPRKAWFGKSESFDAEIRGRFLDTWDGAIGGRLRQWEATPLAALARIVVLDQFSRNLFRGAAHAFAGDALALAAACAALERGFDRLLRPVERLFIYLPFEHAEDLAAQQHSLELFAALRADSPGEDNRDYARRHYAIIARFGRFPHRNAVLGRESTPAEIEFLMQPGSSF